RANARAKTAATRKQQSKGQFWPGSDLPPERVRGVAIGIAILAAMLLFVFVWSNLTTTPPAGPTFDTRRGVIRKSLQGVEALQRPPAGPAPAPSTSGISTSYRVGPNGK